MINVTLDTNCIIDLEECRESAPYIKALIHIHNDQKINLRVVAISASERKPNGEYASTFTQFQEKIGAVGLGHVGILKPLGYWGITFWDWCLWGDAQTTDLERKVHAVLFPEIEFSYQEFCRKYDLDPDSGEPDPRWRRAKCDVLALWSHIYYGGGIFVTGDGNFHKVTKKHALIVLGAGDILRPKDAVDKLTNAGNNP